VTVGLKINRAKWHIRNSEARLPPIVARRSTVSLCFSDNAQTNVSGAVLFIVANHFHFFGCLVIAAFVAREGRRVLAVSVGMGTYRADVS
jgi:hypothetical protein